MRRPGGAYISTRGIDWERSGFKKRIKGRKLSASRSRNSVSCGANTVKFSPKIYKLLSGLPLQIAFTCIRLKEVMKAVKVCGSERGQATLMINVDVAQGPALGMTLNAV